MATERPVRVTYDPEARAAYVYVRGVRCRVVGTTWYRDGTIGVDYDHAGEVVGVELLNVARPVVEELRRGD